MKTSLKLLTILLSALILLSACATLDNQATDTKPIEVVIKHIVIESPNGKQVNVETGNEEKINKSMEIPNEEGHLSQLSFISNNQAFVKIFSGLSVSDVTRLWNDIVVLKNNTKIRDINLFINSPGGDAFSGLALADQIQRAQRKGFHITAHASGIIASAAVPVFAVCNQRFAAPGTIFMVHEAALWKWPGRETASDIRSQNTLMELLRDRYMDKLIANTGKDYDFWTDLEKKTTWFDAQQALDWGLVDKIE
jgi:ATP-dependent protease ClpP protease subunit